MTCHSQIWKEAPVRERLANGGPLRRGRVNQTPDLVWFNHGIHAGNV